jgi:hypothetical protein
VRIKLGGKELEVYNYTETKIKEGEEEIPLFSFEYETSSDQSRREFKELLSMKPIALSLEDKEPIQVMVKNFSESYTEGISCYHFSVDLIPYKRTYQIEDFTIGPLITLIRMTEGLIRVLKDKGILTNDEIDIASKKLFSDEKARDEILKLYYGPEVAEFLKSLIKKGVSYG